MRVAQGTVKWFNPEKGFGFISVDGGGSGRICPLLRGRVQRLPQPGRSQWVEFDIAQGQKGPQAEHVRAL
jgi:CspA family cold shock protein